MSPLVSNIIQNMNMNMLEHDMIVANVAAQTLDPIQHILDKLSYWDQCDLVDFFMELFDNKNKEVR